MANNAITKAERRFQRGIAKCVRAHRKRIGAAQDQIAGYLGISSAHVCNIETGRVRLSAFQIRKLARLFGVSTEELMP